MNALEQLHLKEHLAILDDQANHLGQQIWKLTDRIEELEAQLKALTKGAGGIPKAKTLVEASND
jgi:prefoldin subunit 5